MTIEEKMDHFRSLSLESASSKSAESLSSYKQSLDDDLELHKETASQLAEESKKALMNQVRANSKKKLSSEQMKIKKITVPLTYFCSGAFHFNPIKIITPVTTNAIIAIM